MNCLSWSGSGMRALMHSAPSSGMLFQLERAGSVKLHCNFVTATAVASTGSLGCADCQQHVWNMLNDMLKRKHELLNKGTRNQNELADDFFYAEQSALIVVDSEQYNKSMFLALDESRNVREQHMIKILDALIAYLDQKCFGTGTKIVVWAHNSQAGDARATTWATCPSLKQFAQACAFVGKVNYTGTVTAAAEWGEPPERLAIVPANEDTYEHLLHQSGLPAFWHSFRDDNEATRVLDKEDLCLRYIGVVYTWERDRQRRYYGRSQLTKQFDVLLYYENTRASEPRLHTGDPIEEVPMTLPEVP
eukprot:jgi/Chlat1/5919/Chrsp4S06252